MATFLDCKKSTILTILAGRVPAIVGPFGLGKSQMMKEVADELNLELITIECGLLKEGEVTGLPTVYKRKMNGQEVLVTDYALYNKFRIMNEVLEKKEKDGVLLFLDEFNRSDKNVMQECMNIILNREINGTVLPEDVYITCAMNPTSSMDGYENNRSERYATNDMDPAQMSRLTLIKLDSSVDQWLTWASDPIGAAQDESEVTRPDYIKFEKSMFQTNIHDDIIEYISVQKEALSRQSDNTTIKACPRSWEMVSDMIRTFELNKKNFKDNILANCIKGTIGDSQYISFMQFLNNNKNPLIKGKDLFAGKEIPKELFEKYQDETDSRKYLIAKSALMFIADKDKLTAKDKERYMIILKELPGDMTLALMRFTKNNNKSLHDKLMKDKDYYTNLLDLMARYA